MVRSDMQEPACEGMNVQTEPEVVVGGGGGGWWGGSDEQMSG